LPWQHLDLLPIDMTILTNARIIFKINSKFICNAELNILIDENECETLNNDVTCELPYVQYHQHNHNIDFGIDRIHMNINEKIDGLYFDINMEQTNRITILRDNMLYNRYNINSMQKINDNCYYIKFDDIMDLTDCHLSIHISARILQTITMYHITKHITNIGDDTAHTLITDNNNIKHDNRVRSIANGHMSAIYDATANSKTSNMTRLGEQSIVEKVLNDDNICCISQEEIKLNNRYMKCSFCTGKYLYVHIAQWLDTTLLCPLCKQEWNNNVVLINK